MPWALGARAAPAKAAFPLALTPVSLLADEFNVRGMLTRRSGLSTVINLLDRLKEE